jgi:hypothetical protein
VAVLSETDVGWDMETGEKETVPYPEIGLQKK